MEHGPQDNGTLMAYAEQKPAESTPSDAAGVAFEEMASGTDATRRRWGGVQGTTAAPTPRATAGMASEGSTTGGIDAIRRHRWHYGQTNAHLEPRSDRLHRVSGTIRGGGLRVHPQAAAGESKSDLTAHARTV
jgi:hypothetical protein